MKPSANPRATFDITIVEKLANLMIEKHLDQLEIKADGSILITKHLHLNPAAIPKPEKTEGIDVSIDDYDLAVASLTQAEAAELGGNIPRKI
jgi:hypothetical protein